MSDELEILEAQLQEMKDAGTDQEEIAAVMAKIDNLKAPAEPAHKGRTKK